MVGDDTGGAGDAAAGPDQAEDSLSTHQILIRRDMIRGSLWSLIVALAMIPINFGVNLVVAHSLGPTGLGTFATYTAIFAIVAIVVDAGTNGATVQWLAEARTLGNRDDEDTLIRRCAGYHTFIAGPLAAIAVAAILHSAGIVPCVVAAISVWVVQALGTGSVILTATARNAAAARVALVVAVSSQALVVAIATSTHDSLLTFAYPLGVAAAGQVLTLFVLSPHSRRAVLSPVLTWDAPVGFRTYGWSAAAGALVSTLVFGRSEIFVLKAHGLSVATGLFALSTGLASQITVPMDSLMAPLLPTVTGIYAAAPDAALRVLQRSLRVTSALGAITASIVVPALYLILPALYGEQYSGATRPFGILAFVSCLQSVIVPISAFAFATRSAGAVLRTDLICLVADAVLALTLVPAIGLYGAVTANAAAQVLSLVLLTALVVRRLNVRWTDVLTAARGFTIGPAIGVVAIVVATLLPVGATAGAVIAAGIGAVLFRLVLAVAPRLRLQETDPTAIATGMPRPLQKPFALVLTISGLAPRAPVPVESLSEQ